MYRRSSGRERERDHTEFQLSLINPVAHSRDLPRELFDDLLEVRETKVQPGATIERGPSQELVEVIFVILEGLIGVTDLEKGTARLQPGQIAGLRIEPGKPAYLDNPSQLEVSRLVEVWIRAGEVEFESTERIPQRIEVKDVDPKEVRGTLLPVASGQSHSQTVRLGEDVAIYLSRLYPPEQLIFETLPQRSTFVFLAEGHLRVGEERMHSGDGLAIWRESLISIAAQDRSEFLLIDLPYRSGAEHKRLRDPDVS